MNTDSHIRQAERLVKLDNLYASDTPAMDIAAAQVHALLAIATTLAELRPGGEVR